MKYAIIAAGEGSRLAHEGIAIPKPLVEIKGEALVDRLLKIFMLNDASEIVVICNGHTHLVSKHLLDIQQHGLDGHSVPLRIVVKSTPSSMHSLMEMSEYLSDEPFVLTTVDTVFQPKTFSQYVSSFSEVLNKGYDGLMGVTDFVDDEKPLFVATNEKNEITGFFDVAQSGIRYISGGIYGLTPKAIDVLKGCVERGESRMRNFQRALVGAGLRLKAFPFGKILDIDHASDIDKALCFLAEHK